MHCVVWVKMLSDHAVQMKSLLLNAVAAALAHLLQAPVRHSGHSADGSRGRKGEEQVHKLNMSLVYQHGISGFSGEAKRRSICWWENDWKGIDRSMATCKVAPNDPV